MIGLGGTLAAIAIGHAVSRVPTKLDGWVEDLTQPESAITRRLPESEAGGRLTRLTSEASLPTASMGYTSAPTPMSRSDWLRAELRSYQALESGWDGEGSFRPADDLIEGALILLDYLPAGIALPKAMVSSSGEVGLYWKTDTFYADIVIEGRNVFSLFVRSRIDPSREFFYDELSISEESSALISTTLQQV